MRICSFLKIYAKMLNSRDLQTQKIKVAELLIVHILKMGQQVYNYRPNDHSSP